MNQTFQPHDLLIVLLLVVLEALLSLDNALVLGLLAGKLPAKLQSRALSYGLIGSFIFRLVAVVAAAWLLKWRFVKLLGGLYLLYVAAKHLFFNRNSTTDDCTSPDGKPLAINEQTGVPLNADELDEELFYQTHGAVSEYEHIDSTNTLAFWRVVGSIELTDIAFAADSILAGIALVGPAPERARWHPKLWVIFLGGMLGVLMMRFAAFGVIRLLKTFPRFELSGYLMVIVVGAKLVFDWIFNDHTERLNFESPAAAAFWVFWLLMTVCLAVGFLPRRPHIL